MPTAPYMKKRPLIPKCSVWAPRGYVLYSAATWRILYTQGIPARTCGMAEQSASCRDHSMVQQLVDSGQITREQAALHPQKNLITRALGVSANIVPEYNRCEVVPGDLLLLCTDGLTNMVPDAELALLLQESAFFDAPGVLVDRALKGGGQDNITVLLLGVETTEETNG